MQFHHHGYVSGDPRVQAAAGIGSHRPTDLPGEIDVLIVGSGPAGMLLAAQMSQYPDISTRIIEKRDGRLPLGQADGIQPRSVETFQAFGFAERIIAEAYNIGWMNFWGPNPENPREIVRTNRTGDYAYDICEFPHLIVNQARVLDYFAEAAVNGPGRITPDYGIEFVGLTVHDEREYPVEVRLRYAAGERVGEERTVRAKYVVGSDGARSGVRQAIGRTHVGASAAHAWGVMDVLVNTDFPDWRTKCAINSAAGNILHIPREGGYLSRMYIDLGEVADNDDHRVRQTPIEEIIRKANDILHPYTLDVKQVAWHSVYEVGHRVTDGFDDVVDGSGRTPRVFLTGDACHTHSAKAGQGMNVSMQDGFNLGWKLGSVLAGRAPESLLATYGAERRPVAQQLIDFDREWSSLMARKPEEISDPNDLATYYLATAEFPSGFMTQYAESMITGSAAHQELAAGFPLGKRFKSAEVIRVGDGNVVHLGHHARADGRWRVYAFGDRSGAALAAWAEQAGSLFARFTPSDADADAVFDVKAIHQRPYEDVEVTTSPALFQPKTGPLGLTDWEKVYAAGPSKWTETDIFEARELSRDGVVVVVRPDQYVAGVFPLDGVAELQEFLEGALLPAA
ncbi:MULTISPECIES: FAD-dependent monooxygenase [unclassified Microbacterium]|uniref:FAD-dependent monooxygenase n=1 Tax=unclassified Microbacterium TaxID=2609290 RepID=UPI000EA8D686|nr:MULTISPECIES: FAD-dependent monooxygenase [unclassified Microbacterium]MBT2485164.1 FAD-dependent monooxygenase [Microbacterium sp. ISL-108]RKN68000.1 3-hydroxybenzoate 4-monooxygenase [Microbacterium sp. CGR2]